MRNNTPLIGKISNGKNRFADLYFHCFEQESFEQLLEICHREKLDYKVIYKDDFTVGSVTIVGEKV